VREGSTAKQSTPVLNASGNYPLSYLITFTSYGNWLHGDDRGSVDRNHRSFDEERLRPDSGRSRVVRAALRYSPLLLDEDMRRTVAEAIRTVCEHREWRLEAINVRTNHVHVVVGADEPPEPVMNAFKAWATRRCRESGLVSRERKMWTRHGSTRYLWREADVDAAVDYVMHQQ
jgi:REP element-mobilizing transposase RayT